MKDLPVGLRVGGNVGVLVGIVLGCFVGCSEQSRENIYKCQTSISRKQRGKSVR